MGNIASEYLTLDELVEIRKETGFSISEIKHLNRRFRHLDRNNNGRLSHEDFLRIPELAANPIGDRIIGAFLTESTGQGITFREFVRVFAKFRSVEPDKENVMNSREEKLRFAFRIYDVDGNGKISRDELTAVIRMMVGVKDVSEEQLGSIADRTISEADKDGDGLISFEEFCQILHSMDVELKMSIRVKS